ncbi:hypothetical protein CDD83_1368 [Cordyceps sp. RAO-2017]|nr:hypothetical protein CDD83_1368 [Cordyceps sp. RAO-2017]
MKRKVADKEEQKVKDTEKQTAAAEAASGGRGRSQARGSRPNVTPSRGSSPSGAEDEEIRSPARKLGRKPSPPVTDEDACQRHSPARTSRRVTRPIREPSPAHTDEDTRRSPVQTPRRKVKPRRKASI